MDAVRSWEFLFALVGFLAPTAIAAGLVYRRIVRSPSCRRPGRASLTDARIQQIAEPAPPPPPEPAVVAVEVAPPEPAPVSLESMRQPLANLKQRLVEFRASIQQTSSALEKLQDCDCRFSMDLTRLSETMEAFTAEAVPVERKEPRCDVTPAA